MYSETVYLGIPAGMASIKNHFEQRADLDAFWAADVDFSKRRMGLRTTAQEQVRVTSRPNRGLSASASNGLPSGELDKDNSGDSWLQAARSNAPWDFEAVCCPSAAPPKWHVNIHTAAFA